MTKQTVRIIGIDPGLNHTGWAILDITGNEIKYIASGRLNTDAKNTLAQRLGYIYTELNKIFTQFAPNKMGIEKTFVNQNPTSTLLLGHARAVPIVIAGLHNCETVEFAPNLIKKIVVGYGHATKDQITKMISMLMPGTTPKTPDEADAIAIAYTTSTIKSYSSIN